MNADPMSRRPIAGAKRPLGAISTSKRPRSKLPRRKRAPLFPIAASVFNPELDEELEGESSSSCMQSEVSFDFSLGFAGSEVTKRPAKASRASKSKRPARGRSSGDEFRRITRSYAKKRELLRSAEKTKEESRAGGFLLPSHAVEAKGPEPELSEANAVSEIQISEVTQITGRFPARNLNEKAASSEATEKFPEISESSCFESVSDAKSTKIADSAADQGGRLPIAGDLSAQQEADNEIDRDSNLACSEQLSEEDDVCSEYSPCNEMELSEMESELFSHRGSSEYSLSVNFSSPGDFSERSSENSTPSVAFSLFVQLAKQFVKLGSDHESKQINSSPEFTALRFGEDDEESFRDLRSRERREVVLHDFGEEYSSKTDIEGEILQQRLLMVNWMVEHSQSMELHHETLFLGVSLMDRVLCRGYFVSERNLQLLGIASITLATRLEEVQPWNSIRRRSFTVGSNVYIRSEVVAMEWLLLEVLNFQCMIPTTHNFLWFYLKAAKADAEVENLSRYLAVLSLLDHERLCFWPSTVAAGLVILACLATNHDASSLRVMETHVRSKSDDLPECIQSLEWLVKYAG